MLDTGNGRLNHPAVLFFSWTISQQCLDTLTQIVENSHHFTFELLGAFPPRIVTPEPIRPTKSKFHMPPVDEHLPLPSGMKSDDLPRRIVGSRIPRPIPDFQESAMYDKQDVIVDAALFHGRSFRVGWGPGWTLVHPGVTIAEQVTGLYNMMIT